MATETKALFSFDSATSGASRSRPGSRRRAVLPPTRCSTADYVFVSIDMYIIASTCMAR